MTKSELSEVSYWSNYFWRRFTAVLRVSGLECRGFCKNHEVLNPALGGVMKLNVLRLIIVLGIFFNYSSMAGEWEKGIKRVAIPGGLTADRLPDPQSKGA